jgi:hypothetical protein
MEGLDGALSTGLEAAVDLLGKDPTVATNFVSNLITLPAMAATGLSPVNMATLKSDKRAVVYVPDELVEQPDNQRCDGSDICYVKQEASEGKSCSNIAAIYVGEQSFDLGAKAPNVPTVCGNLCTDNFNNGLGCRAFEVRNAPDDVVYCLLYKGACALGAPNEAIRAQYYYSPEQPGFVAGFSKKEVACGAGAMVLAAAAGMYLSRRKKPFGGKSVTRGGYAPMRKGDEA